ncbi:MAG: hypothetical protein CVT92_09760 [Bacteroidetes bacterium HGW-Bacteroidetes-1]|jgi:outer membrane receptor for ferrienterochelin and colicin|nr:MAG: hypothetical protein CVT92_09760 [Bacteroidetes bacterium HGW-Bacteroidetes-1]
MKINLSFYLSTLILTLLLQTIEVKAENTPDKRFIAISGYISDASNGEMLIGSTIYVEPLGTGSVSNVYGFYSLRLDPGSYNLSYSYIGYDSYSIQIKIAKDTTIHVALQPSKFELKEVIVKGERFNDLINKAQMSVNKLDIKSIRQIPALMGEIDVLKAIQLLPGVQATSEGGSGFSVRGGSPDQNLVLLDEALVYNPSHLLGFFSVFNNDAVKNLELYKGDIPPAFGGRLSSVVDVRMNDGNVQKFSGQGGVGTISSRLMLEGPIQNNRSSFMIAGRRTYADIFLALSKDEQIRNNTLFFYDFNGKANYTINDKNRVFLSGYFGQDVFKNDNFGIGWGNQTATLRWNHLFSNELFSNFSFIYSRFNYQIGVPEGQANAFDWTASMEDLNAKGDFTWYASSNTIQFGFTGIRHLFMPGTAEGKGSETPFNRVEMQKNRAFEGGIYVSNEQKIGAVLTLKYGLRFSSFSNFGENTVYAFNENYQKIDSTNYSKGDFYNTYSAIEPRLSLAYSLSETSSIKAAYTRNTQYVHLAQNSTGGTPLDIWFPSSPNVKPQRGDQFSLGYFKNFTRTRLETSLEGFYKLNHNAIDFKNHAELLLNELLEGELRSGKAWSYGLEALIRLNEGRLNGWLSYTWSRTFREIPDINNGIQYPASYDRPHDISLVLTYELTNELSFGANWVYATGSPVTFPTGRFVIGNTIAPVYSDRNAYRLPDYHRLDLSVTYSRKKNPERKWHGEWNLSVYNAYYRKNPWVINFVPDPNVPNATFAEMTYLFGIVPAITYNFKF